MTSVNSATLPARASGRSSPWPGSAMSIIVIALLGVLPLLVGAFWLRNFTAVAIYAPVAAGTGVLYARLGLVSLCQVAMLGVGGWTVLRLGHGTGLPFEVLLLAGGLTSAVVGVVIGLPAIRFGGLHLALLTLMAAAALEVVFQATQFPDGGHGVLGIATGAERSPLRRPAIAAGDTAYYYYVLLVVVALFVITLLHLRARPGRAWSAIGHGDTTAASVGISSARYKLWALALVSFITGICGGLTAGSIGFLDVSQFRASESIVLFAVVLVGGAFNLAGGVIAAVLANVVPNLFETWGLSGDLVLVVFGIGLLQTIATAPRGVAGQLADLRERIRSRKKRRSGAGAR